jgi:hypothetical protein
MTLWITTNFYYDCDTNTNYISQLTNRRPFFCTLAATPRFGCISSLFSHSFSKVTYWALLDIYQGAAFDKECRMWRVDRQPSEKCIVPLNGISYPLVVPGDNTFLWFLNYDCN